MRTSYIFVALSDEAPFRLPVIPERRARCTFTYAPV
jgi:hypothetical protein